MNDPGHPERGASSESDRRRHRVLSRFTDKQEAEADAIIRNDNINGELFNPLQEVDNLGAVPESWFSHVEHWLGNNVTFTYHRIVEATIFELETVEALYRQERAVEDSVALAERHGRIRSLLGTANEMEQVVVNPQQVEAIRDCAPYREILSELYVKRERSAIATASELADTFKLPIEEMQAVIRWLKEADFVWTPPTRGDEPIVVISQRGETALEKALRLR